MISCPILYSSACALEVVPPDESKNCDLGEVLPPGVISNTWILEGVLLHHVYKSTSEIEAALPPEVCYPPIILQ